jgi:hypothetical protein
MKLSNGGQIISISKPKLEGTHYHFRNNEGQECVIPQDRVVKIEAGAVQTEEKKPAPPTRPKQSKHWYLLWLA